MMSRGYNLDIDMQLNRKKVCIFGTSSLGILKLIDSINNITPTFDVIGFIENDRLIIDTFTEYPVNNLKSLINSGKLNEEIYLINNSKDNSKKSLSQFYKLLSLGFKPINIIHPDIDINKVTYGNGCILPDGCIVGANSRLGNFVTCELRALISHDVHIEDDVYIGLGACIGGGAKLKKRCRIDIGAIIMGKITVGEGSIVMPGAVVNKDVPDFRVVAGVPARIIESEDKWIN